VTSTRLSRAILIVVVAFAAYLRLAHIAMAQYLHDEATIVLMARDILDGRALHLAGLPTSVVGLDNGPLFVYLMVLPLLVSDDPGLASAFVGLLNLAAVIVTYRVVSLVFGSMTGLCAASTFAVGSWAVLFSRKIWPNEAMPLISALLALALLAAVIRGSRLGVFVSGCCLGVLINLHPSGLMYVPVVFGALLLRPRLIVSWAAAAGAFAVVGITTPYILHLAQHGVPVPGRVFASSSRVGFAVIDHATTLVGPHAWQDLMGDLGPSFRTLAMSSFGLDVALASFLALGVLTGVSSIALGLVGDHRDCLSNQAGSPGDRLNRQGHQINPPALEYPFSDERRRRGIAVLLIWLLVPLICASLASVAFETHYLIPVVPALFAFVGVGVATPAYLLKWKRVPRSAGYAVVISLVTFLTWSSLVQVQQFHTYFQFVETSGGQTRHGIPLDKHRSYVEQAVSIADGRPIVVVTAASDEGAQSLRSVWSSLSPPNADIRFANHWKQMVLGRASADDIDGARDFGFSKRAALYVITRSADPVVFSLLEGMGSSPEVVIDGSDSPPEYSLYLVDGARLGMAATPNASLANGLDLRLAGDYSTRLTAARPVNVVMGWRARQAGTIDELVIFVHLLDERRNRISGVDWSGLGPISMASGDEVISSVTFFAPDTLPPGQYWLGIGAYSPHNLERVPIVDATSPTTDDLVLIGPLEVAAP
jgi:hypothetical protein